MYDHDYEDDQPVTLIPQHAQSKKLLGNQILKQAQHYLVEQISA